MDPDRPRPSKRSENTIKKKHKTSEMFWFSSDDGWKLPKDPKVLRELARAWQARATELLHYFRIPELPRNSPMWALFSAIQEVYERDTGELKNQIWIGKNELERERRDRQREKQELESILTATEKSHDENVSRINQKHSSEQARLAQKHKETVESMEKRYKDQIAQMEQTHTREVDRLRNRMASYSTNSYRAIADSDFVECFETLSQKILGLCASVERPRQELAVRAELDPDGYLCRQRPDHGKSWRRFLRYLCWHILLKRLFHLPLGYGALGSDGEGYETLKNDYDLFCRGQGMTLTTNQEANSSRSWRFSAILTEISTPPVTSYSESHWAALFQRNIEAIALELQTAFTNLGHSQSSQTLASDIRVVVTDASMLALKIGSQRAHILLNTCKCGDLLENLEREFICENEESSRAFAVDIMLRPCLLRVGDGHEDVKTRRVLARGEALAEP